MGECYDDTDQFKSILVSWNFNEFKHYSGCFQVLEHFIFPPIMQFYEEFDLAIVDCMISLLYIQFDLITLSLCRCMSTCILLRFCAEFFFIFLISFLIMRKFWSFFFMALNSNKKNFSQDFFFHFRRKLICRCRSDLFWFVYSIFNLVGMTDV